MKGPLRRAFPLFLAVVLGALVFGPGLREGSTVFLGREYVDAWGTQWFYWYVGRQLSGGEGLGKTDLFFHPWGKEVYLHTGANVLDAVLAWPVRWVLGPVAGYNLFAVGIVIANALAMRALLRDHVKDRLAADVGAVLFAFNPFLLFELRDGRPTQALLAFLLLFWRDYLALGRERSPVRAVRAGLFLALAGLTYWYYALFSGIAAAAIALWRAWKPERALDRPLFRHALAGVAALAIVLPFAFPMFRAEEVPGLLDVSKWSLSSWVPTTEEGIDIGVYVFDPLSLRSGFYALTDDDKLAFIPEDRNVLVVQVVLLVLGLFAAPRGLRGATVAMLAVAGALAVGPSVDLGVDVPNVLYHGLVRGFRVFRRLWWPSRALVLAQIALGILGAFALARLLRVPGLGALAVAGIAALWGWELDRGGLMPMPVWPAGIPEGYRCLADADEGAVVELPYAHTQAHLYYQTVHGRPIFGGMVEDNPVFAPKEQVAIQQTNSFVSVLLDQAASGAKPPDYTEADKQAVYDLGYRWVLLDKRAYLDPGHEASRVGPAREGRLRWVRRVFGRMLGAPVYEDEITVVYAPWGDTTPCPDRAGARGVAEAE